MATMKNPLQSKRFRYTQPLTFAFVCLLLLIGVSGIVALRKSKQLYQKLSQVNESYQHLERSLNEVRSGIHTSNVLVRDFLLDPSYLRGENCRSQLLQLRSQTDKSLAELSQSVKTNRDQLKNSKTRLMDTGSLLILSSSGLRKRSDPSATFFYAGGDAAARPRALSGSPDSGVQ